jgi:hypothetical protein
MTPGRVRSDSCKPQKQPPDKVATDCWARSTGAGRRMAKPPAQTAAKSAVARRVCRGFRIKVENERGGSVCRTMGLWSGTRGSGDGPPRFSASDRAGDSRTARSVLKVRPLASASPPLFIGSRTEDRRKGRPLKQGVRCQEHLKRTTREKSSVNGGDRSACHQSSTQADRRACYRFFVNRSWVAAGKHDTERRARFCRAGDLQARIEQFT